LSFEITVKENDDFFIRFKKLNLNLLKSNICLEISYAKYRYQKYMMDNISQSIKIKSLTINI